MQPSFQALPDTERLDEIFGCEAKMHKVAKTTAVAFSIFVLPATRLTEVGDWGELGIQWPASVPTIVEIVNGSLGFRLPLKASVYVSNEVIANIVAHMKFKEVSKFRKLAIEVFVDSVETFLQLAFA